MFLRDTFANLLEPHNLFDQWDFFINIPVFRGLGNYFRGNSDIITGRTVMMLRIYKATKAANKSTKIKPEV